MHKPQWSCTPTKYGSEVLLKFGELELRRTIAEDVVNDGRMSKNQILIITIQQMVMRMRNHVLPFTEVCLFDYR